ncbi:DUF1802 family protein [Poriferisphaera sp. WC338]|uniref:DUF1802 family protein n=1 Tax=Poriferisphaera sp. WC338 TaxID=3425129 RepID=UPI003D814522
MLDIALKEWAVITDLLLSGEQAVVLRKGGIHEDDGPGRFKLEYDRFALFPAWEHQRIEWVKDQYQDRAEEFDAEPKTLEIKGIAEVPQGCIWTVPSREAFDRLDDLHGWKKPQIDMRFDYKPDRPIYAVALRAYRLSKPKLIEMNDDYWGCRSWVDLRGDDMIDDSQIEPAISDEAFVAVVQRIDEAMRG